MAVVPKLSEQPFRFMDLAPELRHLVILVYDELYLDKDVQPIEDTQFTVENAPMASLLRVNRQFSKEYADRIWKRPTLVYTFAFGAYPEQTTIDSLSLFSLKLINKGKFALAIWCSVLDSGHAGRRCTMSRILTRDLKLVQSFSLSSIEVCIMMANMARPTQWPSTSFHMVQPALEKFSDTPSVREIRVLHSNESDNVSCSRTKESYNAWKSRGTEYVTWTEKEGWRAPESDQDSEVGKSVVE